MNFFLWDCLQNVNGNTTRFLISVIPVKLIGKKQEWEAESGARSLEPAYFREAGSGAKFPYCVQPDLVLILCVTLKCLLAPDPNNLFFYI